MKFTGCTAGGAIAGCTVAEPISLRVQTALIEEGGKIYNVYSPVSASVTLTPSPPCPGTSTVTGVARGEIPVGGGKVQKFNAGEKTLKFLGEEAEFEGETEQEGVAGEGIFVK